MGIEYIYQMIPDDCIILKKARVNPDYATHIRCLSWSTSTRTRDAIYNEFMADVEETIRNHPGIERRYYDVDRCWDVLHFLLSEERRQGNFEGSDLGTIAVYGSTYASCLPDWPRYCSPSQVESVVVFLNKITEPELLRWADPTVLIKNCYKGGYENYFIWQFFEGLRNFYREAWRYKGAVLVNSGC